jgi:hypothetical protein
VWKLKREQDNDGIQAKQTGSEAYVARCVGHSPQGIPASGIRGIPGRWFRSTTAVYNTPRSGPGICSYRSSKNIHRDGFLYHHGHILYRLPQVPPRCGTMPCASGDLDVSGGSPIPRHPESGARGGVRHATFSRWDPCLLRTHKDLEPSLAA